MDGMSELVGDGRYITELTSEIQEDEALFSLTVARERSSSLPRFWKYIDTLLFDHPQRIVIEVNIEIFHHRKVEIIRFIEGEVFIRVTYRSTCIPYRKV